MAGQRLPGQLVYNKITLKNSTSTLNTIIERVRRPNAAFALQHGRKASTSTIDAASTSRGGTTAGLKALKDAGGFSGDAAHGPPSHAEAGTE